jgi:hypothetical protein
MASILDEAQEVLHRIRARLYPNYLPQVAGEFIARTDNEAALKIPNVCAAMKNRGGFTGPVEDAEQHVRLFLKEAIYQLCDGFSIDLHYFRVHPHIGGAFRDALEPWEAKKHPVRFTFHVLKPLRDIIPHIEVFIEGVHDGSGFIADFTDVSAEAVNETATPGGIFIIAGHKIKVAGTHADCGVYFVDAVNAASVNREKVSGNLAENSAGKIIGKIPNIAPGKWKVQIITQYTGGSFMLKTPRTIELAHELTVS